MTKFVHDKFVSLRKTEELDMKTLHKNTLVDFLSILPETTAPAAKRLHIIKGFSLAGMINNKYNIYSDFSAILSTC